MPAEFLWHELCSCRRAAHSSSSSLPRQGGLRSATDEVGFGRRRRDGPRVPIRTDLKNHEPACLQRSSFVDSSWSLRRGGSVRMDDVPPAERRGSPPATSSPAAVHAWTPRGRAVLALLPAGGGAGECRL